MYMQMCRLAFIYVGVESLYRRRVKCWTETKEQIEEQMKKEMKLLWRRDRWEGNAPGLLAAFCCLFIFCYTVGCMLRTRQNSGLIFYKILKQFCENFALFGLNVLGILLAACLKSFASSLRQQGQWFCLLYMCSESYAAFRPFEIVWEDYRGENIRNSMVCILIAA